MIDTNQPLVELILLFHQVFDYLSKLEAALDAVGLHVLEPAFVFCEDYSKVLIISIGFNIRDNCVLYHAGILAESKSTKGLLELVCRRCDTKDDCRAGVSTKGGPEDFS